ncbi:MAG: DoxX family protein [Micromonosporaceae bacterium]
MLSGIFVVAGTQALMNPQRLVTRAKPVTDRMGPVLTRLDHRLPTDTKKLIRLNAAVQVGGGLMLATGILKRPAAVALAGSLLPTTAAGHPFWQMTDPGQRREQLTHFLKNLGLFGGLLLTAVDTEGRPGIAWRARHLLNSSAPRRTARMGLRPGVARARRARRHTNRRHTNWLRTV